MTNLTPEQEATLAAIRDRWLAHGLSTDPADRPAAEAGVRRAYERASLRAPLIVWLASPQQGAIAADQVWAQVRDQVRAQVRDQVWDQVGDQVRAQVRAQVAAQVRDQVAAQVRDQVAAQVRDQVRDQVRAQVRAQVAAQVRDQVAAQVRDQVAAQVRDQVRDQVWDQVGDQVRAQVQRSLWGQHDAAWCAWVEGAGAIGCTGTEIADGLLAVARSAGWWWAFDGLAIITERPLSLHRDDRHRLHCEDGPAIVWPDGFGVWAWHGVRVPRALIESPIAPEAIEAERNAEVRRVMVERYGIERYMADGTIVGRDDWGTLIQRGDITVVRVVNTTPEPDGTHRDYILRVPPAFGGKRATVAVPLPPRYERQVRVPRTPHAAVAWTFGLTPDVYEPVAQS